MVTPYWDAMKYAGFRFLVGVSRRTKSFLAEQAGSELETHGFGFRIEAC